MSSTLLIESKKKGKAVVVAVTGDAGMAFVGELQKQLALICEAKPETVVLDMAGLTFISSMGMGLLVNFKKGIEKCGGVVRVAALQPMIAEVFRRARLTEMLEIHDTVDAAVGAKPKAAKKSKSASEK